MTPLAESGTQRFAQLVEANKDPRTRLKTLEAEFMALEASGVFAAVSEIRGTLDAARRETHTFFQVVTGDLEEVGFAPSAWVQLADTFEVAASDLVLPVINFDLAYSKGPKPSDEVTIGQGQFSRLLRVTADPVGIMFMHHSFPHPTVFQRPGNDLSTRENVVDWTQQNNVGFKLKQFYQERFSTL